MSENTASAKAEERMETRRQNRRKGGGRQNQSLKASLNMAELRELAELVNEHGFTDFEFENANIRVRLSKMTAPPVMQAVAPVSAPLPATASTPTAPTAAVESSTETASKADEDLHQITSPIVGTFYRSPSPDKAPYVSEGDTVSETTVVCIVEAMKLMNEIQAEVSGKVVKIYVENGQPVEFGQPLFGIKK